MVFLTQKLQLMTHVTETLWFHPLQYTLCDVYSGIYNIKNTI